MNAEIIQRLDRLEEELDGGSRRRSGYAIHSDIRELIALLRLIVTAPAGRASPNQDEG